ncbi:hypothetical protein FR932_18870 [Moritella marina ATCC 15381]|uniref:Uncharacterized protein n=1 Tax=Moritella marina ATCC 15381 TaxID=1202962 RepID=A0A5J6WQP7_MORMI|nr:hypothetical protein [Moritella marina]QFI39724.1 hypothetical protein FR932_18870 [Moritella marina ATCC 15381]
MYWDIYIDTDAEEFFKELDNISIEAKDMFSEFKAINLEPAAIELSKNVHTNEHPLKQLYIHGRIDTDDLPLKIAEAGRDCESITEFVGYIDKGITDPELAVFDNAYNYIQQYDDNGTFRDMLRLYHETMKLYKRTRRVLKLLDSTVTARIEHI